MADADERFRRRVGPELRWRGEALRAWWPDRLRVPLLAVVRGDARHHDAAARLMRNDGVIVWLELATRDASDGGDDSSVRLLDLPGCSTPLFRRAVELGFASTAGGPLAFEPCLARFPPVVIEEDGRGSPLDDGSAALAAACFAAWHRRGLWPDRPIAVTGRIEGDAAAAVGGIGDKCATAADHGLAFVLTVTRDDVARPANVIGVPPMPTAAWVEAAEAALLLRGVRLVRHPRLQADARFAGGPTSAGRQVARHVNRRLDEDDRRVRRLRRELADAEQSMHRRHRWMALNARAATGVDAAAERAHYERAATLDDDLALALAYAAAHEERGGHFTNPLSAHVEARIVVGDASAGPDLIERLEHDAPAALAEHGDRLRPVLLHAVAAKRPVVLEAAIDGLRREVKRAETRGDGPAASALRLMLADDLTRLGRIAWNAADEARRAGYIPAARRHDATASRRFGEAMEAKPDAPNPLTNLVLHEVCVAGSPEAARAIVRSMHDVINATRQRRRHAAASGIDLPFSRFNAAKLGLLLAIDDPATSPHELVDDYLLGVSTCMGPEHVTSARSTFGHLRAAGEALMNCVPHAHAIDATLELCEVALEALGGEVGRSSLVVTGGVARGVAAEVAARADNVLTDLALGADFAAEATVGPIGLLSLRTAMLSAALRRGGGVDLSGLRMLCLPGGGRAEAGFEVRLALALRAPVCVVEAAGDDAPLTPGWLCRDERSPWRDHPLLTLAPADAGADELAEALDLPPVRGAIAGALGTVMHSIDPEALLELAHDVALGRAEVPAERFEPIRAAATEEIAKELRHCLSLNPAAAVVAASPEPLRQKVGDYLNAYADRRSMTEDKPAAVEAWRASRLGGRELAELGVVLFERLPFRPFYAGPRWADICRDWLRADDHATPPRTPTTPAAARALLRLAIARHNTGRLLAKHDDFFRDDPQWLDDLAERIEDLTAST